MLSWWVCTMFVVEDSSFVGNGYTWFEEIKCRKSSNRCKCRHRCVHVLVAKWAQSVGRDGFLCSVSSAYMLKLQVRWLQLDRLMKEGRVPVPLENQSEIITSIPGLPSLHPLDLPRPASLNPKSTRSDMVFRHFLQFGSASVILLNTFQELEGEALDGLRSLVLGGSDPSIKVRNK